MTSINNSRKCSLNFAKKFFTLLFHSLDNAILMLLITYLKREKMYMLKNDLLVIKKSYFKYLGYILFKS